MLQEIVDVMQLWAPPPETTVCEWADSHLYLSPEESAEHGKYSSARAPYQRGILNAFNEPDAEEITVMSSSQIGKTLILKAIIGYYIENDPAPILVVQPSIGMAETFSKDRISPMFRDTPVLRDKVKDKARATDNTILHKTFPGGHLTFVGAESPSGLASRPIRVLLCDEVDRYPPSAGTEGDPVNLARKRTITYRDRKKIGLFSTPGTKGASRIERAFEQSDQRRYYVPCPHCEHMHTLDWVNVTMIEDDPETACLVCPECGALIGEEHKMDMLDKGVWVADNPTSINPGFHLNELYSPWSTVKNVAKEYIATKGNPEEERTWWNTSMGVPFESIGDKADAQALAERRENYDIHTLPEGVRVLTAGLDVQKDRIEMEVVGWGLGEESWGVDYLVFNGDPSQPEVWDTVDAALRTITGTTADTRYLKIAAACIDSGGHHVQQVYEFATPKTARNVWAIKGQYGQRPVWAKKVSRSRKYKGHTVRMIGVDTAKDTIYSRWHVTEHGKPGCTHFPMNYDDEWFKQATAEKRIAKLDSRGSEIRSWVKPKDARNEATDCRVYAYAALQGLRIERRFNMHALVTSAPPSQEVTDTAQVPTNQPVVRKVRRRTHNTTYLRR